MSFRLTGLGTAVPSNLITQEDSARLARELAGSFYSHGPAIQTLYRKAGIRKRHSAVITSSTNGSPATQCFFPVAAHSQDRGPTTESRMGFYEVAALDLSERAARSALQNSNTPAERISHLVTVSCTGFQAPGIDIGLMKRLGLRRSTTRTHIGFMGCHGALNGLRVAAALANASPSDDVLLCCVELCSLHHQYAADSQQLIANALFSDGAAAVVGKDASDAVPGWRLVDQFSWVLPDSAHLMAWQIGNHGFKMHLSQKVPEVIEQSLRPWLAERLASHGLTIDDVKNWAIHPGGPRILTACAESLGLKQESLEPSRGVLAEFGNMSSPTVLFILERLRAQAGQLPCVVLAFGPGITIEAALLC